VKADSSNSVVNGLFNEAISSCLARVVESKDIEGESEESKSEVKQALFLDETLVFTMVTEKRNKIQ
jgi:hypothetical protein